jgi:hypothetical protein
VGRIRAPHDVGVTGAELDRLIARQRDYFRARGQGLEWKLRAHDLPTDLPVRLVAAGFVPQEPTGGRSVRRGAPTHAGILDLLRRRFNPHGGR